MKILTLLILAVFALSTPVFADDKVCEGVDELFIKEHFKIGAFQIEGKRGVYSLCEVVISTEGNYIPLYVSKEHGFVILGEMFSSGTHLSMESVLKHKQKDFINNKESIEKAVAFSYKPENAKDVLYFFTDPNCPHCEQAKGKLKELADSLKFEIKTIFFPLNSVSRDKAVKGVCGKMTYEDYVNGKYASSTCKEGQEKLDLSMKVGRNLKIGGTPTFITSKGMILQGFHPDGISSLFQ